MISRDPDILTEQVSLVGRENGVHATHKRDRHKSGANKHAQRYGALGSHGKVSETKKSRDRVGRRYRCVLPLRHSVKQKNERLCAAVVTVLVLRSSS